MFSFFYLEAGLGRSNFEQIRTLPRCTGVLNRILRRMHFQINFFQWHHFSSSPSRYCSEQRNGWNGHVLRRVLLLPDWTPSKRPTSRDSPAPNVTQFNKLESLKDFVDQSFTKTMFPDNEVSSCTLLISIHCFFLFASTKNQLPFCYI